MKLDDYLQLPGSLTVSQLRERIGAKSDAQVRQWRHGYSDRRPGAAMAAAIEQATGRAVMRWDLRPNDWHLIWPELIDSDGAPALETAEPCPEPDRRTADRRMTDTGAPVAAPDVLPIERRQSERREGPSAQREH